VIRAFTGPSELSQTEALWVAKRILAHKPADLWRSGCAFGVDTVAARMGDLLGYDIELYKPAARHNPRLVEELSWRHGTIDCPVRSTAPDAYRARNNWMVEGADHLLAFVWKADFYRSGEWMTVNIAHKLAVPFTLEVIPNTKR
jgi:hypothetical protein